MSPAFGRSAHDRANELAAQRVDETLAAADAAWLDAHLAGCDACRETAGAYEADRSLFAPLRDASPMPPRDLWARTAAAIDAEAMPRGRSLRSRGVRPGVLVPVAGLAAVAIVASSVLLNGGAVIPSPGGPGATAMALRPGQVAVITRGPDGGLAFVTADLDEVCPLTADNCDAATPRFETARIPNDFRTTENVDAIMSPGRDRVVMVQRDAKGTDGVFVVPVRAAGAASTTPPPAPTDKPGATAEPGESPATATPSTEPTTSPELSLDPSASPEATPVPVETPGPTDEPTPESTDQPTPSIDVTTTEDGAIQIASDVVVVGSMAAYDADGSRFAFSARPADGSAGPDVYVWHTGDARATAVTDDHGSVLAGWDGGDLLVSRVVDGKPMTVVIEPRTGEVREELGAAWLPTVAPDGATAAWWDGSVKLADDGVTWVPDKGRLVVGAWPGGLAEPGKAQVIDRGEIGAWEVQWDPAGRALAAWTTGPGGGRLGKLGLYPLQGGESGPTLGAPLFEDTAAFGGISLDANQLVYASPDDQGNQSLWVVKWDDEGVGRVQVAEDGTVIR